MLLTKHRNVKSLSEDLEDLGIDSSKFTGQVERMSDLMESRSDPDGTWNGSPPVPAYGHGTASQSAHVDDERALLEEVGDLDEAFKVQKSVKRGKGKPKTREQRAAKKKYRAHKGELRAAGRISRRKHKVARKRIEKRKSAKFSSKQKKAFSRAGKMIRMTHADMPEMDQLREDITNQQQVVTEDRISVYGEAAIQAAMVNLHLFEIFEEVFEEEAAQAMSNLSDYASELSEELDQVDELSAEQEAKLNDILEQTVKALRFHEAMGAPSLTEACEFHLHKLEEDDGSDDEDDDEDTGDDSGDGKKPKKSKKPKSGDDGEMDEDAGDLGNDGEELDEV